MARITGKTTEKRLAASIVRKMARKHGKFTIRSHPGPHSNDRAVPLGFVIRDILGLTQTLKEAKAILRNGKVQVDGNVRKSHKFPVGLFDMVTIPDTEKSYQMVLDSLGRFTAHEVDAKTKYKYCRVVSKHTVRGKRTQINTQDGRTFDAGKHTSVHVGDSLKVSVPSQEITKVLPLEKGSQVYVMKGKHAGQRGTVKQVTEGSLRKEKIVALEVKGNEMETLADNVMVIE